MASIPQAIGESNGGTGIGQLFHGRSTNKTDATRKLGVSSIQKLARRGGIYRMKYSAAITARHVVKTKLEELIPRAIHYAKLHERKTITTLDILYAIKSTPGFNPGTIEHQLPAVHAFDGPTTPGSQPITESTTPGMTTGQTGLTSYITTPTKPQKMNRDPEIAKLQSTFDEMSIDELPLETPPEEWNIFAAEASSSGYMSTLSDDALYSSDLERYIRHHNLKDYNVEARAEARLRRIEWWRLHVVPGCPEVEDLNAHVLTSYRGLVGGRNDVIE